MPGPENSVGDGAPGPFIPVGGQHGGHVRLAEGVRLEGVVKVGATCVERHAASGEAGPGGLHAWRRRRAARGKVVVERARWAARSTKVLSRPQGGGMKVTAARICWSFR